MAMASDPADEALIGGGYTRLCPREQPKATAKLSVNAQTIKERIDMEKPFFVGGAGDGRNLHTS
jgi:hypothetical protein